MMVEPLPGSNALFGILPEAQLPLLPLKLCSASN